nr:uncharacterized protein LOC129152401 [Nothobranchius furzeri]
MTGHQPRPQMQWSNTHRLRSQSQNPESSQPYIQPKPQTQWSSSHQSRSQPQFLKPDSHHFRPQSQRFASQHHPQAQRAFYQQTPHPQRTFYHEKPEFQGPGYQQNAELLVPLHQQQDYSYMANDQPRRSSMQHWFEPRSKFDVPKVQEQSYQQNPGLGAQSYYSSDESRSGVSAQTQAK